MLFDVKRKMDVCLKCLVWKLRGSWTTVRTKSEMSVEVPLLKVATSRDVYWQESGGTMCVIIQGLQLNTLWYSTLCCFTGLLSFCLFEQYATSTCLGWRCYIRMEGLLGWRWITTLPLSGWKFKHDIKQSTAMSDTGCRWACFSISWAWHLKWNFVFGCFWNTQMPVLWFEKINSTVKANPRRPSKS